MKLGCQLNGEPLAAEIAPDTLLLDFLRQRGLTGTKEGCGVGVCGACTVLVRNQPVSSCLMLAGCAEGAEVWTVEGLAAREPDLARAFEEKEALQCGICTPGQLVAAAAYLRQDLPADEASIRRFFSGNLCRCTGYGTIVEAVRSALGGV
ncbi:MAG TPA: (2Fe-2S)-binding protein [Candidatus Acidoferrales bacterium]|nr:(2Fe-2S)-binding protein [Candidatus Acidoferrales bacterium]